MRKTSFILVFTVVFHQFLLMAAWPSTGVVLVDFGPAQAQNSFGLPGWDSVKTDIYTLNVDIGPGGTSISVGDNEAYNYQQVSGGDRAYAQGDIIRVTWYNDSAAEVSFTPKISFNDPDRPISGAEGDWYDMGTTVVGPYGTAFSEYTVTGGSAGIYSLVNVNVNYQNHQALICDKIELISAQDMFRVTVEKSGDGSGIVTSEPSGLDCGALCSESFFPGLVVELAASAFEGSKFSGWSGDCNGDCSGEQTCRLILDDDKTINAQFTGGLPIADFQVDQAMGTAPFTAVFTDNSSNDPESLQWDFNNDGIIDATGQNPFFQYTEPGVYTVSLTAANALGSHTTIKKYLITVMDHEGGTVYEIGPEKPYDSTHDVALWQLTAGDVVRIYAKPDREPYREKFIAAGTGTSSNPIRIIGIPDDDGNKPVFYGYNAVDNPNYGNYYWNEDRQVILIGQYGSKSAEHLILEGFEVHGAVYGDSYTDDAGQACYYASNASGIRVSVGTVTIKDCEVHGNENGIFSSNTDNLLIEGCAVYDNGVHTSSYLQHNLYLGGGAQSLVTVQYCHIKDLLNSGQQAKFRAETLIFRYNWVEGGKNSVLDLVEDAGNGVSNAYVYGNILIKPAYADNGRMIHFGGDQYDADRTGTLFFFNNTCVVKTTNRNVYLFQITEDRANVIADNNIFYQPPHIPTSLYLYDTSREPNLTGENNWVPDDTLGTSLLSSSLSGEDPGFEDAGNDDYHLAEESPAKDIVEDYTFPDAMVPDRQYVMHQASEPRPDDGRLDLGAYESAGSSCPGDLDHNGRVDAFDLILLVADFGKTSAVEDVDGDNDMDGKDLYQMAAGFNQACPP